MQSLAVPGARGERTRDALVAAAIRVFGRDGFHAAGTRALADAAGVNQALIGYHFGGKEGLYRAVFEHIVAQLSQRLDPTLRDMAQALDGLPALATERARRERCIALLQRLTDAMAALMTHDDTAAWAQLILREQQTPSAAFDLLYDGFMARVLQLLTRLVRGARGGDEIDARLLAVGIVGQVLVWRAARTGMLRHLGWPALGPAEIAQLQATLRRSVRAQVMATGRVAPP